MGVVYCNSPIILPMLNTQPNETMDKYDILIRYGMQMGIYTRMESGNSGDRVLTFCYAVR